MSGGLLLRERWAAWRLRHALAIPSHYVDKSHPNLWLAEALARAPGAELSRLADFLGLSSPIPRPEVKRDSLTRWREELGEAEREAIGVVVGGPESPGNTG